MGLCGADTGFHNLSSILKILGNSFQAGRGNVTRGFPESLCAAVLTRRYWGDTRVQAGAVGQVSRVMGLGSRQALPSWSSASCGRAGVGEAQPQCEGL